MKLTYEQIMQAAQVLPEIEKINLPMRFALRAMYLTKAIREHAQRFEEVKQKILMGHAENNVIAKEKIPMVNIELDEAAKETVEVDYEPIDINLLGDQNVSIGVMERTTWMWDIK